ncbi:MAG: hypothetical protein LBP40_00005, partial [Campylobacteraceae bacterium]|nr:hypothetical protein [Campylobacteraceae bacterium]
DNTIVYAAGGESGLFVVDIKSAFVINSINIIDARFVVVLMDMSKAYVVNNKGNIFVVAL